MSSTQTSPGVATRWPSVDAGCVVPYEAFTDSAYYDQEQENIFRGQTWSFVGLEAELPNSGDFKSTFIGESPVIVTRDKAGTINVMQNRCAHRGALVCREPRGNVTRLQCVYHQWNYDLQGRLLGVPFRDGIDGKGGMPSGFDMAEHGLTRLRVETMGGLIFASFSQAVEPLREYLGPMVVASIERIFNRPIQLLGDQRQYMHGKLEVVRREYPRPLPCQSAAPVPQYVRPVPVFTDRRRPSWTHNIGIACSIPKGRRRIPNRLMTSTRMCAATTANFSLADPSLLAGRPEFDDGITLVILAIFPNLVVQQIANTLAVRQTVTDSVGGFELVWTHFGYADDDEDMRRIRIKQSNLIGPAGLISMEDGEAVEIVQKAIARDHDKVSYIAMGGGRAEDSEHLVTESAIIGFWDYYKSLLGITA